MAPSKPQSPAESHLDEWFEDLKAFVCEVDPATWRVLSVGRLAETILGFTTEAWIGQPDFLSLRIHPEDHDEVLERLTRCLAENAKATLDFRMLSAGERTVWFRVAVRPGAGESSPLTLIFSDISVYKRTEDALRESRRRYKHLVDHARDIIFRTDLRGRITYFNTAATRLLRYSGEEILGRPFSRFIRQDYRRKVRQFYERQFVERSKGTYFEAPVLTAEGTCLWLGQNVQLVVEFGDVVGFQGIARDLTDQKRMEERLRDSEERYRIVAETATDAILTFDAQGAIVFVNHACENVFGYTGAEMIGQPIDKLLPDCPRRFNQSFAWVDLTTAQSYLGTETVEVAGLHRNGSNLVLEATIGEFFEHGRHQFTAVIRDVTERHRAAEAIRRSDQRFRSLIENASDLIAILDHEGRVLYASPSVRRILDVPSDEVLGSPASAWVHPDDREQVGRIFQEQLAVPLGAPRQFECRLLRRNGTWRMVEAIGRNLMGEPAVQGYVCNLRDITDRTQAEEELRAAHETLRAVIEASPLAIITLDAEGRLSKWNSAAERMFGWPEAEILGQRPPFVPAGREAEARELFEQLRRGRSFAIDTERQRRSGELIPVAISAAPMMGPDGGFLGGVALLTDLADRLRLEEQLRQAQKMEAVGQLAGGIAHDFNNLLTVITGFGQLLLAELEPGERAGRHAREIMQAAERASALTRQLLAFSRRQRAQPQVLELNSLISSLVPMWSGLVGPQIQIVQVSAGPVSTIYADPVQIEQILLNLVVNGRDAMPQGGRLTVETVNLHLTAESTRSPVALEPGPYVVLSVTDTGVGMTDEVRNRLFEPFFTTKEPGKGTGLGLATVYGIVQQNRGHITVRSEPGAGSTFAIYLPWAPPGLAPPPPFPGAPGLRGGETVLLVEPDAGLRAHLDEMLASLGYRVFAVGSRADAEPICTQWASPIHLLITDLSTPESRGREIYAALRAMRPEMGVLYLAEDTLETASDRGLRAPDEPVLEKPLTRRALDGRIREILDSATRHHPETGRPHKR